MENFWDYSVWGTVSLAAVLLCSLLFASFLRRSIPFLRNSLIPTSVLGGVLIVIVASVYKAVTGEILFDTAFFGGNGTAELEMITYHCLALGFIASAFKPSKGKLTRKRTTEIFNTGVTTVSTYLLQGIVGLAISIAAAYLIADFFPAAGVLLPFGYGQGTGQAMNYGNIYETEFGFSGGKSFGLVIAAFGFISASIGGVIHLNILKHRGKIRTEQPAPSDEEAPPSPAPLRESIDRLTVQIALIFVAYLLAYLLMWGLGTLLPGMKSVIFGFNFLLGVLTATLIKLLLRAIGRKRRWNTEATDAFLMTRASNFFFDLMIVAGIAAIRFHTIDRYWGVMILMGVVGLLITFVYNRIVAKLLFPDYAEEQFLAMYGMLTGTASTGIILLREIDGDFVTPASDNLVYQNFPAIALGFPMMLLATFAPKQPVLSLVIFLVLFCVMNLLLFRSFLFRKRKKQGRGDS